MTVTLIITRPDDLNLTQHRIETISLCEFYFD